MLVVRVTSCACAISALRVYTLGAGVTSCTYAISALRVHLRYAGMKKSVLLRSLLWSLVEVHSQQTFPYVSFMSQTLANHSYVDLSLVGRPDISNGGEGVQCHTDPSTCCTSGNGAHHGDWYFPNGTRLPFAAPDVDTYEFRWAQKVDIRRRNRGAYSPTGIYRCDIPTNAVHDENGISVKGTVYVGLYTASGCNP